MVLRDERNTEIIAGLKNLGHAIENSTGPQRVGAVTQFAVEWYGTGKIPNVVGGVMGIAEFTAMKGVSCIESEINASKTAQKVEALVQESNVQKAIAKGFTDAEKQSVKSAKAASGEVAIQKSQSVLPVRCKILTLSEVVTEIKKVGGKISVSKVGLHHNTEYWLEQVCATVNTKIDGALLEQYNKMTQIAGNAETSVCMDLEHIVNVEYRLILDKSKSFYTVDLTGGHLAGTMSKLAQEGLVEIKSLVEFGGGCIEYQVENLFTGRMFTHTEFPAHWNVEKIAQETKCLVENAITNGSLTGQTKTAVIATTGEGFNLKIITNSAPEIHNCAAIENSINKHIVTSYPYKGKL